MAIIKGIDNGYGYTKDSDFNIFKSAYSNTEQLALTGGGAELLFNACKKRFYDATIIKNNQFSNALGYYEKGKKSFIKSKPL